MYENACSPQPHPKCILSASEQLWWAGNDILSRASFHLLKGYLSVDAGGGLNYIAVFIQFSLGVLIVFFSVLSKTSLFPITICAEEFRLTCSSFRSLSISTRARDEPKSNSYLPWRDSLWPKCPSVGEWISRLWYVYMMDYYSEIKRDELLTHVPKWINLERNYSEWKKPDEKEHIMYDFVYVLNS